MPVKRPLPMPGLWTLVQTAAGLSLSGPLLYGTVMFGLDGRYGLATVSGALAAFALYLPTYVVNEVVGGLLPARAWPRRLGRLLLPVGLHDRVGLDEPTGDDERVS